MNRDRALAVVASTGMILTWLANAATPRPEPAVPARLHDPLPATARDQPEKPDQPDPTDALAFDVQREAERLRVGVAGAPVPRWTGRDPFQFGLARIAAPLRASRSPATPTGSRASASAASVPAPPAIPLTLIGLAERETPDGVVRSAVLSGSTDVFIVAVTDQILGRFTVTAIGADAIELDDAATGRPVRLALR